MYKLGTIAALLAILLLGCGEKQSRDTSTIKEVKPAKFQPKATFWLDKKSGEVMLIFYDSTRTEVYYKASKNGLYKEMEVKEEGNGLAAKFKTSPVVYQLNRMLDGKLSCKDTKGNSQLFEEVSEINILANDRTSKRPLEFWEGTYLIPNSCCISLDFFDDTLHLTSGVEDANFREHYKVIEYDESHWRIKALRQYGIEYTHDEKGPIERKLGPSTTNTLSIEFKLLEMDGTAFARMFCNKNNCADVLRYNTLSGRYTPPSYDSLNSTAKVKGWQEILSPAPPSN